MFYGYEEEIKNHLTEGTMSRNLDLSYNRILKHPTAIDTTDPVNKGVFDNILKNYTSFRWYLVNSIYLLELRHRDSGGWSSTSYPNPTNYHVIEYIAHISKGDKFSILVLATTIHTDNPVKFDIFDIKVKLVYENEEIHTRVITNSNSELNHIWLNNIKKILILVLTSQQSQ